MAFIIPKITYPASSLTPTTLDFTYPPIEKPGIDDLDATRYDSITMDGFRQSMWPRTDYFKRLSMKYVPVADLPNWKDFIAYGQTGGDFLYYPDATDLSTFDTYLLEDSGGSARSGGQAPDAWNPGYSFRFINEFELVFRRKSSILAPPFPAPTWTPPAGNPPPPLPGPIPGPSGGSGGSGATGTVDMLTWTLMPLPARASFHMAGNGKSYHILDTDALYPVGYPANTYFYVKSNGGNPWDVLKYDATFIYHWITENNDPNVQPVCQAAGYNKCFNDPYAYKRFLSASQVKLLPRNFPLGAGVPGSGISAIVLDSAKASNDSHRTADCETNYTIGNLGNIRCVTTGPFLLTWGGSIDSGAGGGVVDLVNGVDTIQNDYLYSGSFATGIFLYRESTFYVQGFGRIAWFYFTWNGSSWSLRQQTINPNKVAGTVAPYFPCGPGKPWF